MSESNAPSREMPRYQSHKIVHALKIKSIYLTAPDGDEFAFDPADAGYARVIFPEGFVAKHNPQEGGYYIVYPDGYKSFSPAEPFESGYTAI